MLYFFVVSVFLKNLFCYKHIFLEIKTKQNKKAYDYIIKHAYCCIVLFVVSVVPEFVG